MKAVILCGGKGFRMKEITEDIPKSMALIGDKPMIWHIMKLYKYYGFDDFVFLLGYKGEVIKEYFMNYDWKNHSFSLNKDGSYTLLENAEKWRISFLDTGQDTMTGGRLLRARPIIGNETFMMTYGDGLSDLNLLNLLEFHSQKGKIATVTGIRKSNQYGVLSLEDNIAVEFKEKPTAGDIINGGFFVLNSGIFNYLEDDTHCIFEREPMMNLARDRQLAVFVHEGFWTAMDTYKDLSEVNQLWKRNNAQWKVW